MALKAGLSCLLAASHPLPEMSVWIEVAPTLLNGSALVQKCTLPLVPSITAFGTERSTQQKEQILLLLFRAL